MAKLYGEVDWSEYLGYSSNSPSGLVWIKSPGSKVPVGSIAGSRTWVDKSKTRPKCWDLRFRGVLYKVHRIIWILKYGSIDSNLVINHIDCNPHNNDINNLELVEPVLNARRARMYRLTTFRGVMV